MADANDLVKAMKKAARDEREASKPVSVFFGEVRSVNPLRISVEQKMVLGEAQLVLTRNVTDYGVTVTTGWETERGLGNHSHTVSGTDGGGDEINLATGESSLTHSHSITGEKNIVVHNALRAGDMVILLRQQEGQKFVVIDRIGGRP